MATVVSPKKFREPPVKRKFPPIEEQREATMLADVHQQIESARDSAERFTQLHVRQLVPHPHNPRKHFDEAKLWELAESFKSSGVLENLVVRDLKGDGAHYQIVCGERRWRAAKLAGLVSIPAVVKTLTDEQALEAMIAENELREPLNPIELAAAIDAFCRPASEGGAGLTPEQAGAKFGKSESWAKNLRRLLQLPKTWKDRVVSGEMPQTFARELVPLIEAPQILDEIETSLSRYLKDESDGEWPTREDWQGLVDGAVEEMTRPIDDDDTPYSDWRIGGKMFGRLFKLSDELRLQLALVKVSVWSSRDGQSVERERATNLALYDKLQGEAQAALIAKKEARKNGNAGAANSSHKPTPAELKAKREQQDEQLAKRVGELRCRWLRSLMADELSRDKLTEGLAVYAWLANESHAGYQLRNAWQRGYEEAAKDAGHREKMVHGHYAAAAGKAAKRGEEAIENLLLAQACLTLYPKGAGPKDELAPLADGEVEAMADLLGCDVAEAWEDDRSVYWRTAFFELHTLEQLETVCREIKSEAWLETKKADKVRAAAEAKSKLPKSLKAKAKRS